MNKKFFTSQQEIETTITSCRIAKLEKDLGLGVHVKINLIVEDDVKKANQSWQ